MRPSLAFHILVLSALFLSSQCASASTGATTVPTAQIACTDDAETSAADEINALELQEPGISTEDDSAKPHLTPAELENFDIPVVLNEAVDKYIRYFCTDKREVFAKWLARTRRYAPVVTEILKKHGLPEDLVYLAMIESGFNMNAFSRAKACGPWQFINETGQRYGLRVNYWVDERRDLEKSTVAAALYLKALFDQFGDWQLAAAGYNAGEGRIGKAIEKHETNDFWKLRDISALPKETREYVPQIFAAAIIAKDPEKFGFTNLDAPAYEPAKIKVPGGISLKGIAHASNLPLTELKSLNPEMLKGVTPPNRKEYILKLPANADAEHVSKSLEATLTNSRQIVGVVKHSVKKKDSLQRILKRYGIGYADLALLNDDGEDLRIKKGKVLYIPRFASLRSKKLSITPVNGPSDEITDMPSGKDSSDRQDMIFQEEESEPTPPKKAARSLKRSHSSSRSERVKVRLGDQDRPEASKVASRKDSRSPKKKVRAARKDTSGRPKTALRLARNESAKSQGRKVRLTALSSKKAGSGSAVKSSKQRPHIQKKAVPHKSKRG